VFSVKYELQFYVQYLCFQSPECYMAIQPYCLDFSNEISERKLNINADIKNPVMISV